MSDLESAARAVVEAFYESHEGKPLQQVWMDDPLMWRAIGDLRNALPGPVGTRLEWLDGTPLIAGKR